MGFFFRVCHGHIIQMSHVEQEVKEQIAAEALICADSTLSTFKLSSSQIKIKISL